MKKFLSSLILFFSLLGAGQAFAQANVPPCKHDVAPFDIGRYDRDMKAGKVVSTTTVPSGTVWETNMKGGSFVVCRTTQERKVAILSNNTFYDIDCGNEVKIALPPSSVIQKVSQAPGSMTVAALQKCEGPESCAAVKWCDENSGWKVEGDERVCRILGQNSRIIREDVLSIDQHLTVIPKVLPTTVKPWEGNGNFTVPAAPQAQGQVAGLQGPQVDMGRSQAPVVSGQPCFTNGCSSRPVANFVSEVKSEFCGIRTNDGRFFKLGKSNAGQLVVSDWSTGKEGKKMLINGQVASTDCDKDQTIVERQHWAGVTSFFGLPSNCQPHSRAGMRTQ